MRKILTYAVLLAWASVCLLPFYWVIATSFKGPLEIVSGPFYMPFVDYSPSIEAWFHILSPNSDLLIRYINSATVGLTSTVLAVLLGAFAIFGLTRYRNAASRTTAALLTFMLATRILPPVVIVLPLYILAQYTGTLDTRFALIFTYTAANLPVAVWLLRPVLGTVATDIEEAAQLDGASRFKIFFTIVVPLAAPGIMAASLFVFVLCWNEYLFAVYLAADHAMTMPPLLAAQMSVREQQAGSDAEEWTHLAAAIVLMVGPLVLCTGFMQRFIGSSWGGEHGKG